MFVGSARVPLSRLASHCTTFVNVLSSASSGKTRARFAIILQGENYSTRSQVWQSTEYTRSVPRSVRRSCSFHSVIAMEGVLSPRESGRLITETAKDVSIDSAGVTKVAQLIVDQVKKERFDITMWKNHPLNPKTSDKAAVDWVFLADTLNFSFWSGDETKKYKVKYDGEEHTGYWSLCAALNRALDETAPTEPPADGKTCFIMHLA